MDRNAQLRLIYRWTHSDFKSSAGQSLSIMVFRNGSCLVPLDQLTDEEINDRLPFAMKKEAERQAKKEGSAA
jgi:hypothetical protein